MSAHLFATWLDVAGDYLIKEKKRRDIFDTRHAGPTIALSCGPKVSRLEQTQIRLVCVWMCLDVSVCCLPSILALFGNVSLILGEFALSLCHASFFSAHSACYVGCSLSLSPSLLLILILLCPLSL